MNMRTSLLPFAVLFCLSAPARAQLHAGEVPDGSNALVLDISIALPNSFSTDSAGLEVDRDDQPDIYTVLVHGAPQIDAPNMALLRMVDNDIEFCLDMAPPFQQRPKYYAFDQLLDCSGDFDWQGGDQIVLGDFGGFTAIGPTTIDSMYIAYRRGAQLGWILLSFQLMGSPGPSLRIHQVLPICPGAMSIPSNEPSAMRLFPNPTHGEAVRVESTDAIRSIEVLDATGRIVSSFGGTVRTIPPPEVAGIYFVRVSNGAGHRSTTRLIRH